VQEVFFILWKKKEEIDLSKQVRSYLASAVRNKCLNWLRDHKKFIDSLIETEDQYIQSNYKPPDKLIENELKKRIQSSIDELPPRCREVFVLSRYENLKYMEIADRLQISVKTVETQMSKALQHLRIRLEEFLPILMIFVFRLFDQ
jgi:RNA polymerase sigma-70 factor, ECF subfamily